VSKIYGKKETWNKKYVTMFLTETTNIFLADDPILKKLDTA